MLSLMKGKNDSIEIPIEKIGQKYSHLRMIRPKVEEALVRSLEQYGQLSPVIISSISKDRYEMVDGFKRLRAGRQLSYQKLRARVFDGGLRACKAAMVNLNGSSRTMTELEKGLVIHSLYREDGLNQVEIATLMGRHKSWVSRRLSVVERLCDEVLENLRIGLINISTGRELARLPRGNQPDALGTVLKYQFTSHETSQLVSILMKEPKWNHSAILNFPEEILSDRHPDRPGSNSADRVYGRLMKIELLLASKEFNPPDLSGFSGKEQERVLSFITEIETSLNKIKTSFKGIV